MDLYIKGVAAAGTSRSTAKLMKTGQTTSYRTGDDGDLEAGRNVDFTTLAENNVFGNTNRFTDELGGSTYTNNIVIDWSTYDGSTVLGWRRTTNGVNITWNNAIDTSLVLNIGGFNTGWRLPNRGELFSIADHETTYLYNYSPFNLTVLSERLWTSSTVKISTTVAHTCLPSTGAFDQLAKTTSTGMRYIPCRTFTVTGTTLS